MKKLSKILTGIFTLLALLPVVALTTSTVATALAPPTPTTTSTALVSSSLSTVAATSTPAAANPAPTRNCEGGFLGIPPWYRGLTNPSDCSIIGPGSTDASGSKLELSAFIWRVVLNVIQIGLVLSAYIAIAFILYGGFTFMTGGGTASLIEKGQKTILNAIIGLAISLGAIAITNFTFDNLLGSASANASGIPEISPEQLLQNGLNITYFIAGIIAVITIVIGSFNFITSTGDSGKVSKARNMITFSIIGLVVILAAFGITNFVLERFS